MLIEKEISHIRLRCKECRYEAFGRDVLERKLSNPLGLLFSEVLLHQPQGETLEMVWSKLRESCQILRSLSHVVRYGERKV